MDYELIKLVTVEEVPYVLLHKLDVLWNPKYHGITFMGEELGPDWGSDYFTECTCRPGTRDPELVKEELRSRTHIGLHYRCKAAKNWFTDIIIEAIQKQFNFEIMR